MAAASYEAHAVAVALEAKPVPVVLHFVEPVRAEGTLVDLAGRQNSNGLNMGPR
jgi:hypothetical protein